jgi:uncharacterized membrane protein
MGNDNKEELYMKKGFKPRELTLLGLLTAVLLVMSFTPLGYLNIGPLAITLNTIPVAVGAIALGPTGGAILGGIFGITSFLQCLGIGGTSAMGVILFEINPLLTFIQRFLPRFLMGLMTGWIFQGTRMLLNHTLASFVAGFSAAFLNTALFMGSLVLLFGSTEYLQNLMGGRNVLLFIVTFVGINAVFEMLVSTAVSGLLGKTLEKAHLIRR